MFCKKRVHKNFAKFTGQDLCWSLFFKKVAGLTHVTLLKGDSNTGVILCEIFRNTFFYRTSSMAASIGQKLVLLFGTDHTGRIVCF